jgi:hypothetical protein
MRFLLLTFLSVLVSCGQGSSSKNATPDVQNQEYITEVRQVDLLDVAMDVPVEVSGNKIIFKESFSESTNGVSTTCSLGVTSGESYDFQISGTSMLIKTSSGKKMTFRRVSGVGDSIVGSWTGRAKEGNQLVLRRMTFVSQDRLVMRTHCES